MLRTKSSMGDSNGSGGREYYYYDNYNNEKMKNEKKTNMTTTTTTTEMISNGNSTAAVGGSSVENHISLKLTLGIHQSKTIQEHEVKQESSTKTDATQDDDDDDNDCPSFAEEGTNYDDVDVEEGIHKFSKSCSSSFIGWVPQIVTFPSTLDDEEEQSALLANSTLTSNYYSSIDYYNIDSNNNESMSSSSEEFCFTTLMAMLGMLSVGLLFGAYISNYFTTI